MSDDTILSPAARLERWCDDPAETDPDRAADDVENLFVAWCRDFIRSRHTHGFSASTYVPLGGAPDIEIVDASRFGAVARIADGTDTIRINSGTLTFLLWAAFKCVLSGGLPFPCEPRAGTPVRRRHVGDETCTLFGSYEIPGTPLARAFAVHVAFQSFLIILFHEVGHLAQGHCRFLSEPFHDYERASSDEDTNVRQPLEFMADLFALRDLCIYRASVVLELGDGVPSRHESAWRQAERFCYGDPLFAPTSMYTALTLTYYLCSEGSRRHPPREIRFLATMLVSKLYLLPQIPLAPPLALRWAITVVDAVTEALSSVHPVDVEFRTLYTGLQTAEGNAQIMHEIDRLIERFKALKPRLESHVKAEKAFFNFVPQRAGA